VSAAEPRGPVRPGEPAPDFTLAAVEREGAVSLADYRGRSAMLLSINRGLWCSFCRRHIVLLGGTRPRLQRLGVETLAIVASDLERARLYVRHRPLGVPLAADPDQSTHQAYGVPRPPRTPEDQQAIDKMHVRLTDIALSKGDLAEPAVAARAAGTDPDRPMPAWDFIFMQRKLYPYELSERERQEWERHKTLGAGQFLVDREGIVRWSAAQSMAHPPAGLGNYPTEAELLAAAAALPR